MLRFQSLVIAGALLLSAAPAVGQEEPVRAHFPIPAAPDPTGGTPDEFEGSSIPDALRSTLEALGAGTGVPDGTGLSWYPREPVRNQLARMSLMNYQVGLTAPVYTTDADTVFIDGSISALSAKTNARLPTDRVRFPHALWNIQAGAGYLGQLSGGWSWGATLNLGTASDHPFNSLAEATLAAMAFLRKPSGDDNAWLFYIVSTSNGQLGRNIPVPGVAYEYHTARLTAVVGFPFVTIDYRPIREFQFEMTYAALTDVFMRLNWHLTDHARVFGGFVWTNQAWFRADRKDRRDQFFEYEKRWEGGFGWKLDRRLDLRLDGGYAFDRFFVENRGVSFSGRNRVTIAPGPFVSGQLEVKY